MNDQYPRRQWWKWLPSAAMLLCILLSFWKGRSLSWQTLSDVMPEKPWQAALVFWGCYAVKSLSVFFPLLVLYAAAGRVFPLSKALLVNLIGLVICESIPYGIGRLSGTSLAAKLREKYPKLLALETLHQRGSFPLAALTRAVGVVPGELASLYFGAVRLPYFPYLMGSLTGLLPMMVADTLLGKGIGGAMSPELLAAWGISVLIAAASLLFCRNILKKTWNHKEQSNENSHRNRQQ